MVFLFNKNTVISKGELFWVMPKEIAIQQRRASAFKGQHQNETGSDGIWDHPYIIDEDNQGGYRLTKPYGRLPGDVDRERRGHPRHR
jgi:hypothetical protein